VYKVQSIMKLLNLNLTQNIKSRQST